MMEMSMILFHLETYGLKANSMYSAHDYHIAIHKTLLRTACIMGLQYYQFEKRSNCYCVASATGFVGIFVRNLHQATQNHFAILDKRGMRVSPPYTL